MTTTDKPSAGELDRETRQLVHELRLLARRDDSLFNLAANAIEKLALRPPVAGAAYQKNPGGDWYIRNGDGSEYRLLDLAPNLEREALKDPAHLAARTKRPPVAGAEVGVLRKLLKEARQYVSDSGTDEDGECRQLSDELCAEIDAALAPVAERGGGPLAAAVTEYARDLRRNSSGGDFTQIELDMMSSVADYLDVLVQRHKEAERGGGGAWQPIETAPKDGTKVDLWHPTKGRCVDAFWQRLTSVLYEESCWSNPWWGRLVGATHWMPLPSGPSPTPETGDGSETIGGGK